MENLKASRFKLVKARTNPGILIFDTNNKLVYSNKEAFNFLPGLRKKIISPEILELCQRVRGKSRHHVQQENDPNCLIIDDATGVPCALRAFSIKERETGKKLSYVMVLVEKIVDRHLVDLDFEKLMEDFRLTKRETGVLRLIGEGFTNKEIARRLFIGEFTVKDHVKKIMDKMNLKSRSEVIASLLRPKKKEK